MKILIKVTKEILEESANCPVLIPGTKSNESAIKFLRGNCAISNAVCEIFPLAETFKTVILPFGSMRESIDLPSIASNFILRFDFMSPQERIELHPLTFEIDVPSEVIDKIGLQEVYKILRESKTLELVNP